MDAAPPGGIGGTYSGNPGRLRGGSRGPRGDREQRSVGSGNPDRRATTQGLASIATLVIGEVRGSRRDDRR